MPIALLSGTSINRSSLLTDWESCRQFTAFGEVVYRRRGGVVVLNRHGAEGKIPPHAINHRANIRALYELGCRQILSLNSVGSLREELSPGTMISCNDYISFAPATFSDEEGCYLAPKVANGLLDTVAPLWEEKIVREQVYIQTRGPRFETPAEVRMLRGWGDVVGMTMASEADLCNELDIDYSSLAMIDNFANGIGQEKLTIELFRTRIAHQQSRIDGFLSEVIAHFA